MEYDDFYELFYENLKDKLNDKDYVNSIEELIDKNKFNKSNFMKLIQG